MTSRAPPDQLQLSAHRKRIARRAKMPASFDREFVEGGWRRVERLYGASTAMTLKWIDWSGGEELIERRRQWLAENGARVIDRY